MSIEDLQIGISVSLFGLGMISCIAGLWTILSHRYRQMLQQVSAQSTVASSKALTNVALTPLVESLTGLVNAINELIRTSVGVGIFLWLFGIGLCVAAYWLLSLM